MLSVLVLLMFATAVPVTQAVPFFSTSDNLGTNIDFNEHDVLDVAQMNAFRLDPTVPDDPTDDVEQVLGYPDGRASGNQFLFEDFYQCDTTQPSIPFNVYNELTLVPTTSNVIFRCLESGTNVATSYGRATSSKVLSFDTGTSGASVVTHSITTEVNMFTNGYEAAIDFMMYIPTSAANPTGDWILPADISLDYTIEGQSLDPLGVAGNKNSNNRLRLTRLGNLVGDGQWKRYALFFAVGNDGPTPAANDKVTITVKFQRTVATHPTMLIDDLYVRYYKLIRDPIGDDLFFQRFDTCPRTTDSPPLSVEDALNSGESSNLWDLNSNDIQCSAAQWKSSQSSQWSLLMGDQEDLNSMITMDRSITRIVDRALEPGQEVTLEFWVRYEESTNPGDTVRIPLLEVALEVEDTTDDEWRSSEFSGETLPGARVVRDEVESEFLVRGFYKYRVTYTLPQTQYAGPRIVRFQIRITQQNANFEQINSGTFYIDDIRMKYSLFTPNSGTVGDPQFVGLYNQNYQVHGIDGGVYNLVSSPTTQVNSRFTFLSEGNCPIFDGIPARNCFAHPGSYLGSIGIQEIVDGVNHKVTIVSGPAKTGFASVEIDGMKLSVNDSVAHGTSFDVNFVSSHIVMVNTADFAFTFENSDMFINQGVAAHRRLSELTSHGLFGQTHKRVVYPSKLKYIEGEVDDYLIAEDDLFGHDFVYNQFHS